MMPGKSFAKVLGLLSEFVRIRLLEFGKVLELPPDRRQLRQMGTFHQAPVGFARDKTKQELMLVCRQRGRQFPFQFAPDLLQFRQGDWIPCHTHEFVFKGRRYILVTREYPPTTVACLQ